MHRSALRMFHANRALGDEVAIPRRRREAIKRSCGATAGDRRVNPERWRELIAFLHATGLRRHEVAGLTVQQIAGDAGHGMTVPVVGKGGKPRTVVVLPGREPLVQTLIAPKQPADPLFPRLPSALDVHACRRAYVQTLYQALAGRPLPPAAGRLPPDSYDRAAVALVSWSLGHRRTDVVLRHYLR